MPWWGPLEDKLSQGDVLSAIPFGAVLHPTTYLAKRTVKPNVFQWAPTDQVEEHTLARGRGAPCIVLSHSCELDKDEKKGRVIVAPIAPIDRVTEAAARDAILAQRRFSMLPLPDIPNMGTFYADLRVMTSVYRAHCNDAKRVASMSDEGRFRLAVQLVAFFGRQDASELLSNATRQG